MEGLIPLVYKAIKRNQTRRNYTCLSNGGVSQSYEQLLLFDHVNNDRDGHVEDIDRPIETRDGYDGGRKGHQRFGSMGEYEMRSGYNLNYDCYEGDNRFSTPPKQQLQRFRSHRMFSCILGEAM